MNASDINSHFNDYINTNLDIVEIIHLLYHRTYTKPNDAHYWWLWKSLFSFQQRIIWKWIIFAILSLFISDEFVPIQNGMLHCDKWDIICNTRIHTFHSIYQRPKSAVLKSALKRINSIDDLMRILYSIKCIVWINK